MEDVGVGDDVEAVLLEGGEVLAARVVEVDVLDAADLLPAAAEADVGRGEVDGDHLGLGEELGHDEGGEAVAGAHVHDPLGRLVAVKLDDPLAEVVLVEEAELGLPEVGDADGVAVEVAAGQEVDGGLVEVVGDHHGVGGPGHGHVGVVGGSVEGRGDVGVGLEELEVLLGVELVVPEGEEVDVDLEGRLLGEEVLVVDDGRLGAELGEALDEEHVHEVLEAGEELDLLAAPVDAHEVLDEVGGHPLGVGGHGLDVGVQVLDGGLVLAGWQLEAGLAESEILVQLK